LYYHQAHFADSIILGVLAALAPIGTATDAQQHGTGEGVLRGIVLHLGVVGNLQAAVTICDSVSNADLTNMITQWDSAVAVFVGSMVGTSDDGDLTYNGVLLYALST
jgi:hypothetical protein